MTGKREPLNAETADQMVRFYGAEPETDSKPVAGWTLGRPPGPSIITCEYEDGSSVACSLGDSAPIEIVYR